jgi:hypothetical protein
MFLIHKPLKILGGTYYRTTVPLYLRMVISTDPISSSQLQVLLESLRFLTGNTQAGIRTIGSIVKPCIQLHTMKIGVSTSIGFWIPTSSLWKHSIFTHAPSASFELQILRAKAKFVISVLYQNSGSCCECWKSKTNIKQQGASFRQDNTALSLTGYISAYPGIPNIFTIRPAD